MFEEIEDDYELETAPASPRRQTVRRSNSNVPPLMAKQRSGRYFAGMRLVSRRKRMVTGLLTYGPSWACWFWLAPKFRGQEGLFGESLTVSAVVIGFMWLFLATPQHEGQNIWSRRWMKTRVVTVRQDDRGRTRVFYPSNWQLFVRAAMVWFIDAYWGWLAMAFSRKNRTFGDMVAKTIVIDEGQVEPELPYAKPRRSWG
jgi:uncharacterized RDD family membrane protein YckC